jgi:hypothetical protein
VRPQYLKAHNHQRSAVVFSRTMGESHGCTSSQAWSTSSRDGEGDPVVVKMSLMSSSEMDMLMNFFAGFGVEYGSSKSTILEKLDSAAVDVGGEIFICVSSRDGEKRFMGTADSLWFRKTELFLRS